MLLTGGGAAAADLRAAAARGSRVQPGERARRRRQPSGNAPTTPRAKHLAFYDQVFEKAAALPGVQKAALASVLPLSGDSDTSFMLEGRPGPRTPSETPVTWYRLVSASYFDTMEMQIRRGRGFETREAMPSVVVNESMVKKFFPGEEPLGRRIRFSRRRSVVHHRRGRRRRQSPRRAGKRRRSRRSFPTGSSPSPA